MFKSQRQKEIALGNCVVSLWQQAVGFYNHSLELFSLQNTDVPFCMADE